METKRNQKKPQTTKVNKEQNLKPRFRRQFTPNYKAAGGLSLDPNSITVPDMSLTVAELLKNHSRGMHSPINSEQGEYFDTEIPRFDDIVEEQEYKEKLAEIIKNTAKKIKDDKEKKQKEAADLLNQQNNPAPNRDASSMGHVPQPQTSNNEE